MGYHTDYTQELQDELNDCKRKYKSLFRDLESTEDELDAVKTDLAHEVNTLTAQRDEYKEEYIAADDAAAYWQETFRDFYGAIDRLSASPLNTDDIVIKIIDKLLVYKGDYEKQI